MAAQHKVVHCKADSSATTRPEKVKGLKDGGWEYWGRERPKHSMDCGIWRRDKRPHSAVSGRKKVELLERSRSGKWTHSILLSLVGWGKQSFTFCRWGLGGGSARCEHCLRVNGAREMPLSHGASWEIHSRQLSKKLTAVHQRLSVYRHSSSPWLFFCKEGGMTDSVLCICKFTLYHQQCLALRVCLLPRRGQLAIRVTSPGAGEGLESFPYQIRLASLSSMTTRGPWWGRQDRLAETKALGLLSPAPLLAAQLLVALVAAVACWCTKAARY